MQTEIQKGKNKARKGYRNKRVRSSTINQPPAATESRNSSNSSKRLLLSKSRQGLVASASKPLVKYKDDDTNKINDPRKQQGEEKRLTYLEAKALSEYGANLSEHQNDHQGAIVALMRVR